MYGPGGPELAMPDCVVLCVNYNSASDTMRYVRSIEAQGGEGRRHVVVVDTSPEAETELEAWLSPREDAHYLRPGRNAGYFGGAAEGLKWFRTQYPLPEWVVVSNVDVTLEGDRFFETLGTLESTDGPLVVAPRITVPSTGNEQNPFVRSRPSSSSFRVKLFLFQRPVLYGIWQAINRVRQGAKALFQTRAQAPVSEEVYAPHGSFVIFNRGYFERGGTIEHGLILYAEEFLVAEEVRRLGGHVVFEPSLHVLHHEHASTGNLENKSRYLTEATEFVIDRYYS